MNFCRGFRPAALRDGGFCLDMLLGRRLDVRLGALPDVLLDLLDAGFRGLDFVLLAMLASLPNRCSGISGRALEFPVLV